MNELRVGPEAVLPTPADAAMVSPGAGLRPLADGVADVDATAGHPTGRQRTGASARASAGAPAWASVAARKAGLRRHRLRLRKRLLIGIALVLAVAALGQIRGLLPAAPQDPARAHAAVSAVPAADAPAVH
jgi:hypothetical protein